MIKAALILCGLIATIAARMRKPSPNGTSKNSYTRYLRVGTPAVIPVKGEYGFINVNADGDDFFYLLYRTADNNQTAPLLIWLSGGPGCASTMAMLYENGPNMIDNVTHQAVPNPYSWNQKANLLFIDQPLGTGFGHSSQRNMAVTEEDVRTTFLQFMIGFYQKHPEFVGRKLFISGESYAGHYVPAVSNKLFLYQNNYFNLQGVAIGNGWTSPQYQEVPYADFALNHSAITGVTQQKYDQLKPLFELCEKLYLQNPVMYQMYSEAFCDWPFGEIIIDPETQDYKFSIYNINEPCLSDDCLDLTDQLNWLSSPEVINEFGVDHPYVDCSDPVYNILTRIDMRTDAAPYLKPLLEAGLKVLAYNGDQDFICNYLSGVAWTNNLVWKYQAEFNQAPQVQYNMLDGTPVGIMKTYQNFQFLQVFGAGHMVPTDRPKQSLFMINQFLGYGS